MTTAGRDAEFDGAAASDRARVRAGGSSGSAFDGAGRRIRLQEVAPRDGLQAEAVFVPTTQKIALVDALSRTGVAKIEATAFVSERAVPALRDAQAVMHGIERREGVAYAVLVPNLLGARRAIDAGADELNLVMSASETHNLANLRMTREQSFEALREVAHLARGAGIGVNVSLSCAFGCPMEGDVPQSVVDSWCRRIVDELGATGISLCDTTGMAHPSQVAALTRAARARWPATQLTLHFHDTRGLALANVLAAIDAGADRFDASLGGLGGCPYAPGATGNACTEDLVHALALMGFDTGIDLARLIDIAATLPALVGHDIPSRMVTAGPRSVRHPLPLEFGATRTRALARQAG